MKKLIMVLLMIAPLSAGAVVVDSSIGQYDVTSTSTTGSDSALNGTAWWGSSSLAQEFAGLVGGSLGLPNGFFGGTGPYFAYARTSTNTVYAASFLGLFTFTDDDRSRDTNTYALSRSVAQVPEPGSIVLFGAGLIGLALLRRRRAAA